MTKISPKTVDTLSLAALLVRLLNLAIEADDPDLIDIFPARARADFAYRALQSLLEMEEIGETPAAAQLRRARDHTQRLVKQLAAPAEPEDARTGAGWFEWALREYAADTLTDLLAELDMSVRGTYPAGGAWDQDDARAMRAELRAAVRHVYAARGIAAKYHGETIPTAPQWHEPKSPR